MTARKTVVAIVQHPPALFDRDESLRRAVRHIGDAASTGAELVVFPESWLSGYPAWVFGAAGWDDPEARALYARFLAEGVVIGGPDDSEDGLSPIRAAALEHGVTVVLGLNERETATSGTLYNSMATIGPDGRLLNLHRKLTPTHTERIVWGQGDAEGLRVVDTSSGRVGGLVCWEHFHPLIRQALHSQDEQIHVASWPDMPEMHAVASRMYAFEGRCFVLAAAHFLTVDDIPEDLVDLFRTGLGADMRDAHVLFDGGSGVVGPDGRWRVPPLVGEPGTIIAEIDLSETAAFKHDLDVAGHYSREDVFELIVRRRRRRSVTFEDEE